MRPLLTVADLCLCRQRSDLASIQQSHGFQTLDREVQKLITTLSEGPKSFEELRTVIAQQNEATREYISNAFQQQQEQFQQQQEQHEAKENRQRLLDSLWFDEIHSREENIVDAHRKTFEWIFDVSDHATGPWDNFIKWLKIGQDTYWINGKAGSGKSTLMSFLCQDDRTLESLRCWSGNRGKNVLMPKFYFWSGGTQMQKSIEGLLRSLIWQVLRLLPDLDITSSAFESRDMIPAWTERRLQTTLQSILQQASSSHLFCLFIDGLDEYEGDQGNLIDFILELAESSAVKVCLSSRPYRVFDQAFGLSAKLRLPDLTHSDIRKVVVDRFRGMPQVQSIAVRRSDWVDNVTHKILARADGVFLWVTLAVKDQIRGLENGDSLEQLRERLESLPDEVEGIYARMLGQIEKVYRKEASILLQTASQTECRSLLEFVLASHDRLEDMLSSSDPLPEQELIAESQLAYQRIVTTCAGLLEVNEKHMVEVHEHSSRVGGNSPLQSANASVKTDNKSLLENATSKLKAVSLKSGDAALGPDDTSSWEDASSKSEDVSLRRESADLQPENKSDDASSSSGSKNNRFESEATDDEIFYIDGSITVDFIHRTARDYMRDAAQGGTFLKANTPLNFHPQVSYVKVLLAKARLFGSPHTYVDSMMYSMRLAEYKTGVAQTQLCHLMDDVMSGIDRNYGARPTHIHWSIRWGGTLWSSMHEELSIVPDSKVSCASSSDDSFHSVNSQPDTPDEVRKTLIKKPDFLALAVYSGLHRYVQQVIHDRQEPLDTDTVSYLLYCAVHSLKQPGRPFSVAGSADDQSLIKEFLRRGGKPNLKDSSLAITIWSTFLVNMHDGFLLYYLRFSKNTWEEGRRDYMETAVAFVEKGADLHSIFAIRCKAAAGYYWLDLDLSALAAIDLCLNSQLEHPHLRDLWATRGAPYYSRCTQVRKYNPLTEVRDQRLRLSDHESTAILEIYKEIFADGSSRYEWFGKMERYLVKLFQDRIEDVTEDKSVELPVFRRG